MNECSWRNKEQEQDKTIHTWLHQWLASQLLYTPALKIHTASLLPITDYPLPLSTFEKCPMAAEKNDTQLVCRLYCPFGRSGSVTGATAVELPLSSDRFFFFSVSLLVQCRRCK